MQWWLMQGRGPGENTRDDPSQFLSSRKINQQSHGDGTHGQCDEGAFCFQPCCQRGDKGPDVKIARAKIDFAPGCQDAYGSEGAKNSGRNK